MGLNEQRAVQAVRGGCFSSQNSVATTTVPCLMNKHISIRIMQAGFRITHLARSNYNTFRIRAYGSSTQQQQQQQRGGERERGGGYSPFRRTTPTPHTFPYTPSTSPDTTRASITIALQGKLLLFFVVKKETTGACKRVGFERVWVDFGGECNVMRCSWQLQLCNAAWKGDFYSSHEGRALLLQLIIFPSPNSLL